MPDSLTVTYDFDAMRADEKGYFKDARPGETVEYYLPAGYLNFIIELQPLGNPTTILAGGNLL